MAEYRPGSQMVTPGDDLKWEQLETLAGDYKTYAAQLLEHGLPEAAKVYAGNAVQLMNKGKSADSPIPWDITPVGQFQDGITA